MQQHCRGAAFVIFIVAVELVFGILDVAVAVVVPEEIVYFGGGFVKPELGE